MESSTSTLVLHYENDKSHRLIHQHIIRNVWPHLSEARRFEVNAVFFRARIFKTTNKIYNHVLDRKATKTYHLGSCILLHAIWGSTICSDRQWWRPYQAEAADLNGRMPSGCMPMLSLVSTARFRSRLDGEGIAPEHLRKQSRQQTPHALNHQDAQMRGRGSEENAQIMDQEENDVEVDAEETGEAEESQNDIADQENQENDRDEDEHDETGSVPETILSSTFEAVHLNSASTLNRAGPGVNGRWKTRQSTAGVSKPGASTSALPPIPKSNVKGVIRETLNEKILELCRQKETYTAEMESYKGHLCGISGDLETGGPATADLLETHQSVMSFADKQANNRKRGMEKLIKGISSHVASLDSEPTRE